MERLTPIKAIRAKCKDCTCNQLLEIRDCEIFSCPLWIYRMGKRPKAELQGETLTEKNTLQSKGVFSEN